MNQGLAHGRDLREAIAHNIRLYFDRFENEARLPRRTVLDWAARYLEAIRRDSPDYAEGMEGVAEGAGADLLEVAALNVRYELLYYRFGRIAMDSGTPPAGHSTEGCTAFGLLPAAAEADHLIHGQNWDWIPGVAGAVLHTTSPDGMQSLAFTEAGIFGGKIGINSRRYRADHQRHDDDRRRLVASQPARARAVPRYPALPLTGGGSRRCHRGAPRLLDQLHDLGSPGRAAAAVPLSTSRPLPKRFASSSRPMTGSSIRIISSIPTLSALSSRRRSASIPTPRPRTHGEPSGRRKSLGAKAAGVLSATTITIRTPCAGHEAMQDPPSERYITVTSVIMEPGLGRLSVTRRSSLLGILPYRVSQLLNTPLAVRADIFIPTPMCYYERTVMAPPCWGVWTPARISAQEEERNPTWAMHDDTLSGNCGPKPHGPKPLALTSAEPMPTAPSLNPTSEFRLSFGNK